MTWLIGLAKNALSGIWGYVAAAGAVLVAVLTVYRSGKSSGSNEVIVETKEKEVENVRKANEVERKVDTSKPSANRERLRDKWTRD